MAVYNVVTPCIVGGKHYIHPADGVEVDDAEAGPLVESGVLVAVEDDSKPAAVDEAEAETPEAEAETPRRGRASR